MIARESDLDMCSLRDACGMDASSSLHAGEKSPDFAMKSGLDVNPGVSKVTSTDYDRSVYPSERDGRRRPDLRHVEAGSGDCVTIRRARRHRATLLLPTKARRRRATPWPTAHTCQL